MLLSEAIKSKKKESKIPVVAEIKARTPRDGDLLGGRPPVELAREMEAAGAAALSVVTEPEHFGGDLVTLQEVVENVSLPVLRKDFITTREQVYESMDSGAKALLLICSIIPPKTLADLNRLTESLDIEAVIEVHDAEEMRRVSRLSPKMVGINNRDIARLETDSGDVGRTEELAPLAPDHVLILSESSIKTRLDVKRAVMAGADAVLIGTALMKASNIGRKLEELMSP